MRKRLVLVPVCWYGSSQLVPCRNRQPFSLAISRSMTVVSCVSSLDSRPRLGSLPASQQSRTLLHTGDKKWAPTGPLLLSCQMGVLAGQRSQPRLTWNRLPSRSLFVCGLPRLTESTRRRRDLTVASCCFCLEKNRKKTGNKRSCSWNLCRLKRGYCRQASKAFDYRTQPKNFSRRLRYIRNEMWWICAVDIDRHRSVKVLATVTGHGKRLA